MHKEKCQKAQNNVATLASGGRLVPHKQWTLSGDLSEALLSQTGPERLRKPNPPPADSAPKEVVNS